MTRQERHNAIIDTTTEMATPDENQFLFFRLFSSIKDLNPNLRKIFEQDAVGALVQHGFPQDKAEKLVCSNSSPYYLYYVDKEYLEPEDNFFDQSPFRQYIKYCLQLHGVSRQVVLRTLSGLYDSIELREQAIRCENGETLDMNLCGSALYGESNSIYYSFRSEPKPTPSIIRAIMADSIKLLAPFKGLTDYVKSQKEKGKYSNANGHPIIHKGVFFDSTRTFASLPQGPSFAIMPEDLPAGYSQETPFDPALTRPNRTRPHQYWERLAQADLSR